RHFTAAGVPFGYNTADALISRSGSDMFVLSGECEKLIAYSKSHGECEITPETVDFVACPDLSEEAFALSNAILSGDRAAALDALSKAKNRREEPIALLYSVSKVMSDMLSVATYASAGMTKQEISKKLKMHEYKTGLYMRAAGNDTAKLERSINRCLEADLAMKSSTLGYIALERLICG
ncbi:MAG: DNA polymerase III subunit delta, partial [Lachnospiraceae bacterium]